MGVMYGRGGRGCGGQRWDGIIIGQTDKSRAERLTGRTFMRELSDGAAEARFFQRPHENSNDQAVTSCHTFVKSVNVSQNLSELENVKKHLFIMFSDLTTKTIDRPYFSTV